MIEFDDNDHDDDFYRDGGYWSLLSLMIYEDVKDKRKIFIKQNQNWTSINEDDQGWGWHWQPWWWKVTINKNILCSYLASCPIINDRYYGSCSTLPLATLTRDNAFHRLCLNFTKSNELFPPTVKCSLSHHQWPLIAASGLHIEQLWMMGKNHLSSTLNIEKTTFDERTSEQTSIFPAQPLSNATLVRAFTTKSWIKLNHWVCSFAMNLCFA